jgi:hypothetical protein
MTPKEKLIIELDKILNEIPKNFEFIDYVFVCSKSFECKIITYKGIEIYFDGRIQENTIYYMENPYFDFDNYDTTTL